MATSNGLPPTLRVEELSSGISYGYVLPGIARMVLSGFFPTKAVTDLADDFVNDKLDTEAKWSKERLEAWESFKSHLVAWMVRQPKSFTVEEVDDPEVFPADDRAALFLRAVGSLPAPKAQRVK